ncbi:hypothetical protein [Nocardioides zeae]|uniref:Lipoprotein n=1 Tax=Nocardioides zeae TaxID=1457234 RepID=A0A6P0HD79_9ACTN|nr:hypothetical protein [Nocardioides zeae]NEN76799.1 hypothetical protein [Nocardioides zeae]
MSLRHTLVVACALACATTVSACGGSSEQEAAGLTADAAAFDGLDQAVVEEVLENPDAVGKIEDEASSSAAASMAQGITINFVVCRRVAADYRTWVTTGAVPTLAALPEPTRPQQPSYADWQRMHDDLAALYASGDPAQVRGFLTGESSCGHWIPAEPGDVSGPTVEDVVGEIG